MADAVTTSISVLALVVSSATAWLTLFRRGTVKVTQPTVIYFGPDKKHWKEKRAPPKVYLRALLFATSKRGRIVQSMHVSLTRNEARQTFNIWVHGESKLVRGSGLFVGEAGVAANHHFLAPPDGTAFAFIEGSYHLELFAQLLGDRAPKRLLSQRLDVSRDLATALTDPRAGLYFDWGPDSGRYLPHIEVLEPELDPTMLMDSLRRASGQTAQADPEGE
jgi:hypothetical protein